MPFTEAAGISDPGAADNLELGGFRDQLLGQLRGRADGEAIILANDFSQFFGRLARDHIDIAAALAKNLLGLGVHLVGNEYAGFGHFNIHFFVISGLTRDPACLARVDRECGTPA
jgi:hypothetical protein